MFNSKQKILFGKKETETSAFVKAGLKQTSKTLSDNGALKYTTTGNVFVDQFGILGNYKSPRSFEEISKDCELLWGINPLMSVTFIFYIRMITRVVVFFNGISTKTAQKGAELKHEGIMRMIWLHFKAKDTFWKNITLFISIGSWKDIFTMLSYDLIYHNWENKKLDWDKFGYLILSGLENKHTSELVKKYLPQIKSNSQCTTLESQADNLISKWICQLLYGNKGENSGHTYKKYRKLKSNGTAHEWQKLISQKKFDRIEFDKIHGRALNLLVRSKFLKNQNLTVKFNEWINKTKTVKYTGFVHELFSKLPRNLNSLPENEQITINKQFETLVNKGEPKNTSRLIVVRDTSGSMSGTATGTKVSCYNIAKALALYFSEFLKGSFSNSWIEFNRVAKFHKWIGNNPLEKWYNDTSDCVGNTNFLSVIDLFIQIKNQGVPEEEFPTGILCISDGEFDSSSLNRTNIETIKFKFKKNGFSEEYISNFVVVLWNLQSRYGESKTGQKFETFGNIPNVFYFSGYSASVISFLTDNIKNAEELLNEALNQEVLQMIEL